MNSKIRTNVTLDVLRTTKYLIRLDNSCVERGRRKSEIQYPTNPEMVV